MISVLSFFLFIIVPLLSGQVYPSYSFTDMEKKKKSYSFVLCKWHSLHFKIGILNLFPLNLCFHLAIHFLNHLIVYNHKVVLLVSLSFRKSLNGKHLMVYTGHHHLVDPYFCHYLLHKSSCSLLHIIIILLAWRQSPFVSSLYEWLIDQVGKFATRSWLIQH